MVIEAIADGRLILPHPEVARVYAGSAAEPDRWLKGMSKLQHCLRATQPGAAPGSSSRRLDRHTASATSRAIASVGR